MPLKVAEMRRLLLPVAPEEGEGGERSNSEAVRDVLNSLLMNAPHRRDRDRT